MVSKATEMPKKLSPQTYLTHEISSIWVKIRHIFHQICDTFPFNTSDTVQNACVLVSKSCLTLFLRFTFILKLMLNPMRRHSLNIVDFNGYANGPCSHFDGSKRYIWIANDMLYYDCYSCFIACVHSLSSMNIFLLQLNICQWQCRWEESQCA